MPIPRWTPTRTLVLAASAGIALAARVAPAQPADLATREFGQSRVPSPRADGPIEFAAQRVSAWTEHVGGVPVTRLVLRGDARVRLGIHSFAASRAAAWIAPLPEGDPESGPGVFQVFVYFDRVGTPDEDAAVALAADRLSVQGVFRAPEGVVLRADLRTDDRPRDGFVREAERKLAAYLDRLAGGEQPAEDIASPAGPDEPTPGAGVEPLHPGASRPFEPATEDPAARRVAQAAARLAPSARERPIFASTGIFTIASGEVVVTTGEQENIVTATGDERNPVTVVYWDARRDRTLQLTAERAVVFVEPGAAPAEARFSADQVRGVYLEGDVYADDGQYRVRAPRVYYSRKDNRALLIDAVFWTYDEQRGLPLYVRAKTIEQLAENRYTAQGARLTNTAFFDPGLSLGASSVTVAGVERDGHNTVWLDARNLTVRAGGLPVLWFPRFRGDPTAIPIRELRVESSNGTGVAIKTGWNGASLLGFDLPPGHSLEFLGDYYFERGPALGLDWTWDTPDADASIVAYTLPTDSGSDLTSTGRRIDRDGDFRGLVQGEYRGRLSEHWTMLAQGFWISDETFVDAFFDPLQRNRREFENSIYARRTDDNTSFTMQVKSSLVDFVANDYLLQSQGYTVQRMPEGTYTRLADDLLPGISPGLLTYSSDTRLGRVRFEFDEPEARDRGFTTNFLSQRLFGITPDQSIADALRAQGLDSTAVTRFDTRHEVSAQLAAGPVRVTPFVVGRVTMYDRTFTDFSPDADERVRTWGAGGAHFSTEFHRIDNGVESRFFDLHRVRHVVSPSITVWSAHTNVDREDLPIYDETVESVAQGDAIRLAVDQTWQTHRGGPGRTRSVDVFKLNTELVFSDDTGLARSPIGRFIGFRPEQSSLGDFAGVSAAWQVTEVVALAAESVYDFDLDQQARTSVGAMIQHSPDFSVFADVRYINSQDQTFADFGVQYVLTPKYTLSATTAYDTDRTEFQSFSADVRRAFPNVWVGVGVSYNDISGDTTVGFVLQPRGLPGVGGRPRGFGAGIGGGRSSLLGG